MHDYKVLNLISNTALKALQEIQLTCVDISIIKECNGFLCQKDGTCGSAAGDSVLSEQRYYNIITSVAHIYFCVGDSDDLAKLYLPIIDKVPGWAYCFDRKHVSIHTLFIFIELLYLLSFYSIKVCTLAQLIYLFY